MAQEVSNQALNLFESDTTGSSSNLSKRIKTQETDVCDYAQRLSQTDENSQHGNGQVIPAFNVFEQEITPKSVVISPMRQAPHMSPAIQPPSKRTRRPQNFIVTPSTFEIAKQRRALEQRKTNCVGMFSLGQSTPITRQPRSPVKVHPSPLAQGSLGAGVGHAAPSVSTVHSNPYLQLSMKSQPKPPVVQSPYLQLFQKKDTGKKQYQVKPAKRSVPPQVAAYRPQPQHNPYQGLTAPQTTVIAKPFEVKATTPKTSHPTVAVYQHQHARRTDLAPTHAKPQQQPQNQDPIRTVPFHKGISVAQIPYPDSQSTRAPSMKLLLTPHIHTVLPPEILAVIRSRFDTRPFTSLDALGATVSFSADAGALLIPKKTGNMLLQAFSRANNTFCNPFLVRFLLTVQTLSVAFPSASVVVAHDRSPLFIRGVLQQTPRLVNLYHVVSDGSLLSMLFTLAEQTEMGSGDEAILAQRVQRLQPER
eukprot:gnl/Dysnectes_brevis/5582_a8097_448.p1 GENE.gnl/Dysnectes_brevis/5582_a8097_448~~gnl/Dysnectes_brevis/5582_a8097_448.p1  ORF type:complete len:476 (+),score=75.59 gnl/Dysnectes_brevis/5582_a8097_448:42-1469(+)